MRILYRTVIVILTFMLCSCALARQANLDKMREECERSVKDYNKMLRWREIENAGMVFVGPGQREAFLKTAGDIRKREVVITDYRILTRECTPEKKSAEVLAEFDYYVLPSNRIKTLTYRQEWVYLDTEEKKGWQVTSRLPEFD